MSESAQPEREHAEPPKSTFYDELSRFVRREDIIQFFRLTKHGVFMQEDAWEILFSAYQSWQQKVREENETLTVEKIRKRLIGADPLRPQYLIEGKKCLIGYLLPHSQVSAGAAKGVPQSGTLFDPSTYLDVRDPIFTSLSSVKLVNTPQSGIALRFLSRKGAYECGTDVLRRFAECCRSSPRLMKEFPETAFTLRGCLEPLKTILDRGRPVPAAAPLLVPAELLRGERSFLQYGSLLIALRGSRIHEFFDRKGKGELAFLKEEIEKLRRAGEHGGIKGFSPPAEKSFHLGKIWVRGMSFLLHPSGLKQYIRLLPRSESRQRFSGQFSVQDVLKQLIPAFVRSQVLDDEGARKLPVRYRQAGAKYRRFADWVFIVTDKNVVSSCIVYRASKRRDRRHPPAAAPLNR